MRYWLLSVVLMFTWSCSVSDFDSSVQVEAWLRSLDQAAEVIEVRCTGNVEEPPGSGTWKEWNWTETLSARQVLAKTAGEGLDWDGILGFFIGYNQCRFRSWALETASKGLTGTEWMTLMMNFRVDDVRCDSKPLKSPPPIRVGRCPNDLDGCGDGGPPLATDLPPPLPPPPGGGDF